MKEFTFLRAWAACLASLAVFPLVACGEAAEARYATVAEAAAAGAFSHGWLPVWIPAEATAIREAHDVANQAVMVRFQIPKGAALRLLPECEARSGREVPPPPLRRSWWPDDVPHGGWNTPRSFSYKQCVKQFVAHSSDSGEVFVWSLGS
ncbi:hypothetical protein AACH06_28120 [Ideonella sp. DXS29W]|uniref:YbbD head domain-containing protein n=1 Tax=Ideonella lacteola TaxID=2984193 RepID=A0ABU9BXJ5_9BURK